ncbi:MAG: hypothetical protein ACREPC_00245 [Stenotrophomonas sp.]|uniref:hypothetical protein n=1 Tax=Stenotrophomonas sp. TaxID=69392 RepID=UPI003D6CCBB4
MAADRIELRFRADRWLKDRRLRSCSPAARGVWVDVMLHLLAQERPGVVMASVARIAKDTGADVATVRELATAGVLRGSDQRGAEFTWAPSHAGRKGEPIVLLSVEQGACWYCPELVREAHVRERRTASIRGVVPIRPPMASNGDVPAVVSLAPADPAAGARACLAMRKAGITSTAPGHPSLLAAIAEGATMDMFAAAARRGAVSGKGFVWVVATVRGELMGANRSASRARAFGGGGG